MPTRSNRSKSSKQLQRKRRTRPPPLGAQVPGSARLRQIKVSEPALWERLARLVGEDNLNNHAAGRSTPRGKVVGIYDFHAGIRSWSWMLPDELVESGIAFAVAAPEDEHEPHAGPCGGGE